MNGGGQALHGLAVHSNEQALEQRGGQGVTGHFTQKQRAATRDLGHVRPALGAEDPGFLIPCGLQRGS